MNNFAGPFYCSDIAYVLFSPLVAPVIPLKMLTVVQDLAKRDPMAIYLDVC